MSNEPTRIMRRARFAMAKAAADQLDARSDKARAKAERRQRIGRRAFLEAARLADLLES